MIAKEKIVKHWILMLVLLLSARPVFAAGWVDNLDGTESLTVTITVPTQTRVDLDQVRADYNQEHFYSGEERDASIWLKEELEGAVTTRSSRSFPGYVRSLWRQLKRKYVARQQRRSSGDDGDVLMRAYTIPSPVPSP